MGIVQYVNVKITFFDNQKHFKVKLLELYSKNESGSILEDNTFDEITFERFTGIETNKISQNYIFE